LDQYEEVHQNCLFHCCGDDLRGRAGGGSAFVQEHRQELPYEQRQGMQLRQKLRLLSERTKAQPGEFAYT
jgi:hypothetical protein